MKKLILLLLISIACFGQINTRRSSGGSSFVGLKDTTLNATNDAVKSNVGVTDFRFGDLIPITISEEDYYPFKLSYSAAMISGWATGGDKIIPSLDIITVCDSLNGKVGADYVPYIGLGIVSQLGEIVYYIQTIGSDSSFLLLNRMTDYGLKIDKDGILYQVSASGTKRVLVEDDLGANFGASPSENLTMTDFKQSPDYAEFLEFQKYLAMKKNLAKKE